jgi:hypothetical protein
MSLVTRLGRRRFRLQEPGKLRRTCVLALVAMITVLASCASPPLGAPGPSAPLEPRPACDNAEVIAQLLELARDHPNHAPGMPSPAATIGDIAETRASEIPDVGSHSFLRLCVGKLTLQSGEVVDIGWEIFTTDTVLGPAYGLTPCFGKYDAAGRDCAAFREGRIPGEAPSVATPAG